MMRTRLTSLLFLTLLTLLLTPVFVSADPVGPDVSPTELLFPATEHAASLVITGPEGYRMELGFEAGTQPRLSMVGADGATLLDGVYEYELRSDKVNAADAGAIQPQQTSLTGRFVVAGGAFVTNTRDEPRSANLPESPLAPAEVVHAEDVVITGQLCVGLDCVSGNTPDVGIRLKENNVRIDLVDTSITSAFPTNDWQIRINDSNDGGDDYFAVKDVTASLTPLRINAAAPTNSLFITGTTGNVGLGTGAPAQPLHIERTSNPFIRLEQKGGASPDKIYDLIASHLGFGIRDTSLGTNPFGIEPTATSLSLWVGTAGRVGVNTQFPATELHIKDSSSNLVALRLETDLVTRGVAARVYDLISDPQGFAVKDVSSGNLTPFAIGFAAPTDSLKIHSSGQVGMGTGTPSAPLHIRRIDGSARLFVEEASTTFGERTLGLFRNKGALNLQLDNTDVNRQWLMGVRSGGTFRIQSNQAAGGVINFEMNLDGALTISGNMTVGSCSGCTAARSVAESSAELLAKLGQVPIRRWSAPHEDAAAGTVETSQHLTPDMSVFHALYGLGLSGDGIAPLDVATVALAAAQALAEQDAQHSVEIAALQTHNQSLEARIAALEAALGVQAPVTPDPELQAEERLFMPSTGR